MPRFLLVLLGIVLTISPAFSAGPPLDPIRDPLPAFARLRIGSPRFRHGGIVRGVAFSPDGKRLASAGHDGTVSVWAVPTGRELFRFRGHGGDVLCVAFSGDGRLVASGGADWAVRLWSTHGATAGKEIRALIGKAEAIEALAFSPDGKMLAVGGDDGSLRLFDIHGKLLRQMIQDRGIRCLAWSADGKVIATNGAKNSVAIWNADKGVLLQTFGDEAVNALAFAPAGRRLVTWEEGGTLRLWHEGKRVQLRSWGGDAGGGSTALIYQIAFSRDGKSVLCGSTTGPVDEWDPETGKRRRQFTGHRGRVPALAVAPQGSLVASGGADSTIRLWNAGTGKEATYTALPAAPILSLSVDPKDTRIAIALGSGEVQLWDRATGKRLSVPFKSIVRAAILAPKGMLLVVDDAGTLVRWDLIRGAAVPCKEIESPATALALSQDGKRLLTSHSDGTLWLRDGAGGPLRACLGKDLRSVSVISPDGSLLAAVGQSAAISLWDGKTGRPVASITGHRGGTLTAVFSPDGRSVASGGRDGMVRVWEVLTRRECRRPSGHEAWVCAVAYSPDGKLLASATVQGDIHVWNARTGRLLRDLEGHRGPVSGLAFADGKTLVSAGRDNTVLVWDVAHLAEGKVKPIEVSSEQRERLWDQLMGEPAVASLAIQRLAYDPAGAVTLLRSRLAAVDGKQIAKHLRDMDANDFKTRKSAIEALAKLGCFAEGSLRQEMAKKPNLEKHRRLEELLVKLTGDRAVAEHLRALRCVEVLEIIGTAEARKVLQDLAAGAEEAELTRSAMAAVERMKP